MRFRLPLRCVLRPAAGVLAVAASGCSPSDEVDAPGVEFAPTAQAGDTVGGKADDPAVGVWARVPYPVVESAHPYAHNTRSTHTLQVAGAERMKVEFTRFETESQYDPLELRDADGRVVARYSGRRGAFSSATVEGDLVELGFRSDASVAAWGYRIEAVRVFGLGCLADDDCGDGYVCPQTRRCLQAPCFQTCEPDPDAPPPAPPTQPPAPPTQPPAPPTQPPGLVSPWQTRGELAQNEEVRFPLALPADARDIRVTMTGTGDADLYTRFSTPPTLESFACRPYAETSAETCEHARVEGGGPLYLMVRGYQARNAFELTVTWQTGAAPPPPAPPVPPAAGEELDVSGELSSGAEARHQVVARAGQTLVVTLTGTGDADLYVRAGAAPTQATWDCRPYLEDANETCTVRVASDGPVHMLVRGYSARSTYRLRTRR